ncbi:hypothetical protein BDA99DRAFT_534303 [Phascolomyces articulosus]|uniref:Uncharacterized protein n=1 Tax=Phascolomyces articulosus TaxID=60185 RepID=A0AAD5KIH1_9FUNG|nr:hypothetical protein BDA99DRAFT_534303 [Phascolomyces articulosus]
MPHKKRTIILKAYHSDYFDQSKLFLLRVQVYNIQFMILPLLLGKSCWLKKTTANAHTILYIIFVADKIGSLNTLIIYNTLSGCAAVFICVFAYNYIPLLVFSVVYGLFESVYYTLLSPVVARVVGTQSLLPYGNIFIALLASPACFGPSIASAIELKSNLQPFFTYELFLGIPLFISVIPILYLKLRITHTLVSSKI